VLIAHWMYLLDRFLMYRLWRITTCDRLKKQSRTHRPTHRPQTKRRHWRRNLPVRKPSSSTATGNGLQVTWHFASSYRQIKPFLRVTGL
jgi:hypothetical protein